MVQPSSIDVRMDKWFRLFDNHKYPVIDPAADQPDLTRLIEVDPVEGFVLHPGEFVLGSTLETVTLPDDLAARVEGKSSLGRLGLLTHATAGFVDPGFSGHVTLELRSEEHTSELQSRFDLVCRLLLEKKQACVTYHDHRTAVALLDA